MAKTYLTVSFNEKDAAKSLGAKWDAVQRQWYVPDGRELTPFSAWLPAGVDTGTASLNTGLAPFSAGSKELTARKNGVSLSQLLAGVSQAVAQTYKSGVWTMVEVVELRVSSGHVFIGVSERDAQGAVLAKSNAVIWQSTANSILPEFERATGAQLASGIKLLVRARPVFKPQHGFSLEIDAIDSEYTIDGIPIDAEVLHERILQAVLEFAEACMLWRVSASSCINDAATGAILNGIKGQRLYVSVLNASLIPEASKIILERLWAAGMGWIEVGVAGQALKRTLIDASVFQGNRLDFAGQPQLTAELTRSIPDSRYFGDPTVLFDLSCIKAKPEISRKAKAAQTKAKTEAKPALQDARAAHVAATAPEMAARRGISVEVAKGILQRATDYSSLAGDFELLCQDGTIVTVGEILNRPDQWDGKNFADPLEPAYGNCNKTVARAHLKRGRSPCINSFAHGGMNACSHCSETTGGAIRERLHTT